jgi:hypothetical protein
MSMAPPGERVEMRRTVDVTIPVETEAAAALSDPRKREAVGRLVSRMLRSANGPTPLGQAISDMKAAARAAGLADDEIDAEIAAHNNTERRERRGKR